MYRVSPRQALVILFPHIGQPDRVPLVPALGIAQTESLVWACLNDIIGAAIRVDGVIPTLVCPSQPIADWVLPFVPAGFDIVAPPSAINDGELAAFGIDFHENRKFERIVAVRGDTLTLAPRTLGTAFGVLAGADVAIGPGRGGGVYLVGVQQHAVMPMGQLLAGMTSLPHADSSRILDLVAHNGWTARKLEPKPLLSAYTTISGMYNSLIDHPDIGPNVAALLRSLAIPSGETVEYDESSRFVAESSVI